jgi:hypothetical protein
MRSPSFRRTKLALRRETIARLTATQLRVVAGGDLDLTRDKDCNLSQLGVCGPNTGQCGDT